MASSTKRTKRRRKSAKFATNRVLIEILHLLRHSRPEKVSFSRISRKTGVPRTTLYYYFGSSQIEMLNEALRFGMNKFIQADVSSSLGKFRDWKSFEIYRLERSVQRMLRFPWIIELYFMYRDDQGPLGQTIRDYEELYLVRMMAAWRTFHGEQVSPLAIRTGGYLKIGLLYGLAHERKLWRLKKNAGNLKLYLDKFCDFLAELPHS